MRTDFQFTCLPPFGWLFITGELDLSTHFRMQDAFRCLRLRGCTDLELDLEGTKHIDAHSLGTLYGEQLRLRRDGGRLTVRRASPEYRLISRLAGYTSLLPPATPSTLDTASA